MKQGGFSIYQLLNEATNVGKFCDAVIKEYLKLTTKAACTKKYLNPLKLLDFFLAEKRIYAKLTPRTLKNQAHNRVTKTDAHSTWVSVFYNEIPGS